MLILKLYNGNIINFVNIVIIINQGDEFFYKVIYENIYRIICFKQSAHIIVVQGRPVMNLEMLYGRHFLNFKHFFYDFLAFAWPTLLYPYSMLLYRM